MESERERIIGQLHNIADYLRTNDPDEETTIAELADAIQTIAKAVLFLEGEDHT